MSSLEETPGPEMGVSDKGDIQNVQCWGVPRAVTRALFSAHNWGSPALSAFDDTQKTAHTAETV